MFEIIEDTLKITLPEGKTQDEIIEIAVLEFPKIEENLYGKHLQLNGRITTSLALFLGHKLAHIVKSVSIFDPKENAYVKSVWH